MSTPPLTYAILRTRRPTPVGTETMWVESLLFRTSQEAGDLRLNLTPDYQRGRVWTDQQASRFVGFLAEGGEAPTIIVQRWPSCRRGAQPLDEVVDGLQRLTAVLRFARGEIPLETMDGEIAYLRDFSPEDQRYLIGTAGLKITLQMVQLATRAEVLALYLRLNRGGTPHSESEIERVRALLDAERAG